MAGTQPGHSPTTNTRAGSASTPPAKPRTLDARRARGRTSTAPPAETGLHPSTTPTPTTCTYHVAMVADAVDAALREAQALLGTGQAPTPRPLQITTANPAGVASWRGIASDRATATSAQLAADIQQLRNTHLRAAAAIEHANAVVADARHQLAAIQAEWEHDKAVLSPIANTPAGHAALLAAGALRIDEAGALVVGLASQLATLAQEVLALTSELPTTPEADDGIQLIDHTVPQAPPPDPDKPPTGTEIAEVLHQLPIGNRPHIREVRTPEDLQNLWEWAIQGGTQIPDGYGQPSKGTRYQLPDGTTIGQRPVAGSNNLPALDFTIPGQDYTKVHINPRGGVPDMPTPATPPDPTWGTYIPPEELINSDNPALRILGQMILDQLGPNNPRGHG